MTLGIPTVDHQEVSGHSLQLFDSRNSLAGAVARFAGEGLEAGDNVLLVMQPLNWDATAQCLRKRGVTLREALASGRLTVLSAAATLQSFMRCGGVDRERFEDNVGTLIGALGSASGALRVYGEMVDLLAAEGDFRGALELETVWNGLRERESFQLFCGYSAVSFGDPRVSEELRLISRAHSHVHTNPSDILGTFLLQASAAQPHTPR